MTPTTHWSVETAAQHLAAAERERRDVTRITDEWPGLDLAAGYEVQRHLVAGKLGEGQRVIGVKLGLTSEAKQRRMGIDTPLVGVLTDGMLLDAGAPVPMAELIHPRVEPEIVFVMADDLEPGATADEVLAAVGEVRAGAEIIDSRYRDFDFALPDVVADNASSARFYLGTEALDPAGLDLAAERVTVTKVDLGTGAGEEIATATGAAVQGHPAHALALATVDLARRGDRVRAGDIVLTGGMTDAAFVLPGEQISIRFDNLGRLDVRAG